MWIRSTCTSGNRPAATPASGSGPTAQAGAEGLDAIALGPSSEAAGRSRPLVAAAVAGTR